MRWCALTAVLLTGGSMLVPASAAHAADGRVLTFADKRITESSGLVDLGASMVTTNDSDNPSVLFVVNAATGRTVGVTDFHADTVDVEALAPAGRNTVWVGDIGDNDGKRRTVSVYRVKVGAGRRDVNPSAYRLAYPKGGRNAESLFADRTGRLYIVTKSFLGGVVYRAPFPLSRTKVNRLQPVARVADFATDAAMFPDGKHVIVRGPGRASVYTFPSFQRLGTFGLPAQRQGEGVSIGPGERIRLSSEGARSVVRQVALPAGLVRRIHPPAPAPSPSASPSASASASPSASPSSSPSPSAGASDPPQKPDEPQEDTVPGSLDPWLLWSIPGVIALGAIGIGLGLRRRSE